MSPSGHIKKGHRILVVDDDRRVLHFLRLKLMLEGNDVSTVTNGQDALTAIEHRNPDVVILDVAMPGMSGLDVLKTLRASSDVPVIVMSARSDFAAEARRLEADSFMAKPFDPDELVQTIEAILRSRAGIRAD